MRTSFTTKTQLHNKLDNITDNFRHHRCQTLSANSEQKRNKRRTAITMKTKCRIRQKEANPSTETRSCSCCTYARNTPQEVSCGICHTKRPRTKAPTKEPRWSGSILPANALQKPANPGHPAPPYDAPPSSPSSAPSSTQELDDVSNDIPTPEANRPRNGKSQQQSHHRNPPPQSRSTKPHKFRIQGKPNTLHLANQDHAKERPQPISKRLNAPNSPSSAQSIRPHTNLSLPLLESPPHPNYG
jgi:hypothetical protein